MPEVRRATNAHLVGTSMLTLTAPCAVRRAMLALTHQVRRETSAHLRGQIRDEIMAVGEKLVLVGVVNRKKDLEIAFKQGWYRMPLKHAPKRKANLLALYQTRIFGKDGKCIRYYVHIKALSFKSRRELLPEEGGHPRADEIYCKLDLGPLKRVPQRIENQTRRRLVFGFTTLEKLLRAREVSQLFDISPIEDIMRKAIAEAGIKAMHEYCLMVKRRCRYRLDFAIFCKKGNINVECDNERWHTQPSQWAKDRVRDRWLKRRGWRVLRLGAREIRSNLRGCVILLKQAIQELGGTA